MIMKQLRQIAVTYSKENWRIVYAVVLALADIGASTINTTATDDLIRRNVLYNSKDAGIQGKDLWGLEYFVCYKQFNSTMANTVFSGLSRMIHSDERQRNSRIRELALESLWRLTLHEDEKFADRCAAVIDGYAVRHQDVCKSWETTAIQKPGELLAVHEALMQDWTTYHDMPTPQQILDTERHTVLLEHVSKEMNNTRQSLQQQVTVLNEELRQIKSLLQRDTSGGGGAEDEDEDEEELEERMRQHVEKYSEQVRGELDNIVKVSKELKDGQLELRAMNKALSDLHAQSSDMYEFRDAVLDKLTEFTGTWTSNMADVVRTAKADDRKQLQKALKTSVKEVMSEMRMADRASDATAAAALREELEDLDMVDKETFAQLLNIHERAGEMRQLELKEQGAAIARAIDDVKERADQHARDATRHRERLADADRKRAEEAQQQRTTFANDNARAQDELKKGQDEIRRRQDMQDKKLEQILQAVKLKQDQSPIAGHSVVVQIETPHRNDDSSGVKTINVKSILTPQVFASLSSGATMNVATAAAAAAAHSRHTHAPQVVDGTARSHAVVFHDEKQLARALSGPKTTTTTTTAMMNTTIEVKVECPAGHSLVGRIYVYVRPGSVNVVDNETKWMCVDSKSLELHHDSKTIETQSCEQVVELDEQWSVQHEQPEVLFQLAEKLVLEGEHGDTHDSTQAIVLMKAAAQKGHTGANKRMNELRMSKDEVVCTIKDAVKLCDDGKLSHAEAVMNLRNALVRAPSGFRKLDLHKCKIGDAGAGVIAEVLPQSSLTALDLDGNSIGDAGAGFIADALPQSSLTTLYLAGNSIGAAGAGAIAEVLPQSSLTTLWLNNNSIGDAGAGAIADALPQSSLTTLGLSNNSIGDAGAGVIADVLPQSSLTTLDLSNNSIGDAGAGAIADALPQSSLTYLHLRFNSIGDAGAGAIADALPQSSLTTLDLSSNSIGDAGAGAIADALPQSSLTTLYLGNNSIGDAGAGAIADALPQSSLTSLWLNSNSIGDAGAGAIADALPQSSLTLRLSYNSIGDSMKEQLKKAAAETNCTAYL
jgi:Leucine Rich repeat